ncbi:MAG: helix-turn-helix domain-containing protein [Clostridium sp.]|uniref:helix-turn-helix domain-containing protein n=1 Tax=Clostridium sp. TaxID=1506 RepID=UPI00302BD4CD
MWNVGNVIKDLREDKNLTQKQFAEMLGTTPRSISYYENGDRKIPIDMLPEISKILEVPVEYILTGKKDIITNAGIVKLKFKSGNSKIIKNKQMQDFIKMLEENKIDAEAFIQELNEKYK